MEYLTYQHKKDHSPQSFIESFWTLTNTESSCELNILPDNCIDIVYDLKHDNIFVCGLMTRNNMVKLDQNSQLLGIRVSVEHFPIFTNVPLQEIKNLQVDGSDLGIIPESSLAEIFDQCDHVEQKLFSFGNSILKLRKNVNNKADELISLIIRLIRVHQGKVSLKYLESETCMSIRQMQRRFKQRLGLTIKEFAGIIRFNHAIKNMHQTTTRNLLDIAFESGFYDHAHMANEFKKISGFNPSFFRECRFSTNRIIIQ